MIRAKSVHSNRLSPSRDIAIAFAHGNRIRHLLSGGFYYEAGRVQTVGKGVLGLIERRSIITDYLGIKFPNQELNKGMLSLYT